MHGVPNTIRTPREVQREPRAPVEVRRLASASRIAMVDLVLRTAQKVVQRAVAAFRAAPMAVVVAIIWLLSSHLCVSLRLPTEHRAALSGGFLLLASPWGTTWPPPRRAPNYGQPGLFWPPEAWFRDPPMGLTVQRRSIVAEGVRDERSEDLGLPPSLELPWFPISSLCWGQCMPASSWQSTWAPLTWITIPMWLFMIAALAFPYARHVRRRRRARRGLCVGCAYDLRGSTTGRCPECNTPTNCTSSWVAHA